MSPNRLAKESSPYLQQHADNPVDWYPWGEEALAKAKKEGKPILLSIGYSACHWCHVMEKESFEDTETARLMNENFVNVKVDREERPDLDAIYMKVVQALTGQGGWPMTVFLTPDGRPFYGGTYFPPEARGGLPSFKVVLREVARAFRERRKDIEQNARIVLERLNIETSIHPPKALSPVILENAFLQITYAYDKFNGGFGGAPKFPQPSLLDFLLWLSGLEGFGYAARMVNHTLIKMARGGIYDHLGGGFHRYSVDAGWVVPHFEKMLYDNAQLSSVYLHAYQLTQNRLYQRVVEDVLDYVIREMRHPLGGFYSTQDADSEGEEGRFYLWTKREVEELLGNADGAAFCRFYGVSESGNLEGKNVLNISSEPGEVASSLGISIEEFNRILDEGRVRLFEARERRVKPGRDEKVIASWNGLMMKGFAEAARVLKRDDYRRVAEENAKFILENLYVDGRLMHSWRDGKQGVAGFLEDYTFLADGLLSLYQTTFDPKWFKEAYSLADMALNRFQDQEDGGFYDTADDHESLITRPKTLFDHSTPSGGSVATQVLQTLYNYTGEEWFRKAAEKTLNSVGSLMEQQPTALSSWLTALASHLSPSVEVALVGAPSSPGLRKMLPVIFEPYRPNIVVALQPAGQDYSDRIPLLKAKTQVQGKATAYVCRNFSCERPTTDPEELARSLDKAIQDVASILKG